MELKCIFTLSCLSFVRNGHTQDPYNLGVVNPERIYFEEAGQRYPTNVLPLDNKQANWPNQDANNDAIYQNPESSYLQANRGNDFSAQAQAVRPQNNFGNNPTQNQNLNNNQNPNQRPANNVQPFYEQTVNDKYGNNAIAQNSNLNNNLNSVQRPTTTAQPQYGQLFIDKFGNIVNVQNTNANNNFNTAQKLATTAQPQYYGTAFTDGGTSGNRPAVTNTTAAVVDPVSLALTDFSIRFMRNVPRQQGNLVVSPFSVATLLALLQQGSLGTTQQQLTAALQLAPSQAAEGFRKLTESLNTRSSPNILNVATNFYIADAFNVNPAYKRIAKNDFRSEVTPIKFNRPAVAAQKINNWVASQTNDKIQNLITPEAVSAETQLVLVNAVYFKGLWAVKFKPEATMTRDFYLSNGGKKPASFMRMRRNFRTDFDKTTNSQVLVLPFESNLYSLVLILPSQMASVTSVLALLTKEHLLAYQNFTPKEVAIELPKFTVKTDTDLVTVLRNLGISSMFGPQAELSGIGLYREFSPQVSSALHTALLSIDEQGGVAAAASAFAAVALSYDDPSVIFNANRPFLAVLWDNTASIPLFMARIEDPVS